MPCGVPREGVARGDESVVCFVLGVLVAAVNGTTPVLITALPRLGKSIVSFWARVPSGCLTAMPLRTMPTPHSGRLGWTILSPRLNVSAEAMGVPVDGRRCFLKQHVKRDNALTAKPQKRQATENRKQGMGRSPCESMEAAESAKLPSALPSVYAWCERAFKRVLFEQEQARRPCSGMIIDHSSEATSSKCSVFLDGGAVLMV